MDARGHGCPCSVPCSVNSPIPVVPKGSPVADSSRFEQVQKFSGSSQIYLRLPGSCNFSLGILFLQQEFLSGQDTACWIPLGRRASNALPLQKVIGRELNMFLSDDLDIPLVGIHPRERKGTMQKPVCELMVGLSVLDRQWPNVKPCRTLLKAILGKLGFLCVVDHCPLSMTAITLFIRTAVTSCKRPSRTSLLTFFRNRRG